MDWKRWQSWLVAAVLAAVTLAAFAPVLQNSFVVYDDHDYVTENPQVRTGLSWANAAWAFRSERSSNWHPLTWLSHQLDSEIYGLNPAGHHLTSLLFHIATSVMLFGLLKRLTGAFWRSALVAAFFALHPLHVESVAWASERKDVLSGFFFMLTLWAYARYAEECGRKNSFYLLSLLFFALGLMSKPMLVTVPFVLLLLDYWPLCRTSRTGQTLTRLLLEKLPYFALSAASCVVTFLVQHGTGAVSSLERVPLGLRLCNALISYVLYVWKMVWPAKLAVFYPLPVSQWPVLWVMGAALLLAGVTAAAVWVVIGKHPTPNIQHPTFNVPPFAPLLVGWFWFLGMLVPVIGIVQVGQQAMADRYTYLPMIGLFVAVVWGLGAAGCGVQGVSRKSQIVNRIWSATAILALVACVFLTWRQAGYWRDSRTLFTHALAVTRENTVAHNNLASALLELGDVAGAEEHFQAVLRLRPKDPEAMGNMGFCCEKQGRRPEAREWMERSLELQPTAPVEYNLANLLSAEGKLEEAQAHYEAALRLKPGMVEAWYNLGLLEAKRGQTAAATRAYAEALRLKPDYAGPHLSWGALLAGQQKYDEAILHFQQALQAEPSNVDARFNLAASLNAKGDFAGAAAQYAEVCRLHPQDAEARGNLALALLSAGRLDEAVEQFRPALQLRPDARLHFYLALALDAQGRPAEALTSYRDAARLSPSTPLYLNDLAWFLATNPKAELRNGAEAVQLAERARDLSGGKEARFWGTLDAAYAEAGRFADALTAAAKARDLAKAAGQAELAQQAEERMALYRAGKPWRVTPSAH